MSKKFHINKKGEPGRCRAIIKCPYGGASEHYDTPEAARHNYEESMKSQTFGFLPLKINSSIPYRENSTEQARELMQSGVVVVNELRYVGEGSVDLGAHDYRLYDVDLHSPVNDSTVTTQVRVYGELQDTEEPPTSEQAMALVVENARVREYYKGDYESFALEGNYDYHKNPAAKAESHEWLDWVNKSAQGFSNVVGDDNFYRVTGGDA